MSTCGCVRCWKSGGHGSQTLTQAVQHSCNVAFAQIAQELGPGTLEKYTEQAGLTDSYSISGLPTAKGSFDFDGITDGQLGWAGVGQYHDQVNPAALMIYMGVSLLLAGVESIYTVICLSRAFKSDAHQRVIDAVWHEV